MMGRELFDKCAEVKRMKDGSVQVHCKLGLWSVSGHDEDYVMCEAWRYWRLYYSDGEYDRILNKTTEPSERSNK